MDLDGDGKLDVLSGSYSREEQPMAGLLQVLWGKGDGKFAAARALDGRDGQPLIIPAGEEDLTDKICTRPTACDLDGDGKLDLVVGNFSGTFAWFRGQGKGGFEPQPAWLEADGERLSVPAHGDPCVVDWDGDGDLDLLSGSAQGGVWLFENRGSKQAPKFAAAVTLLEPEERDGDSAFWDEARITGPQHDTRVNVGDVDGDGKLDLLVGDSVAICRPAAGLDEAKAKAKLAEWDQEQQRLIEAMQAADADGDKLQEALRAHYDKREQIVREERTGFVWVLYRK